MRLAASLCVLLSAPAAAFAQAPEAGRRQFEAVCASCHGGDGNGGERGPAIVARLAARRDDELAAFIRDGVPAAGMPGFPLPEPDMRALVAFLRTLRPKEGPPPPKVTVQTTDGRTLAGVALNQTTYDMQLLSDDRRVHLLRKEGDRYRPVTSQADWPTYHGRLDGNRYSRLDQINRENVRRLAPRWTYPLGATARLQVTPVVVDGVMYVTAVNECHALDAGTGRLVWHYKRPRTKGLSGDAGGGNNRGVAVAGDLVFMVTDHAHLIALDRFTGALRWDTEMADWRLNYGATSAPLAVGRLVVSGTSGGDEGARGFLAAFEQATGKEVWRFWSVPRPGEPGSETWQGKDIAHGGAPTWFTGSYDPVLDLVYWPTGNPTKEYNGDDRQGDNLYANSILALERKTGRRVWHFQFTPHDLWDWDATQTSVLVDAEWEGRPRPLMLHANRNGFYYVLDRRDGTLLLARPFIQNLTWASAIGADGRPILVPGQEPSTAGTKVCPSQDGATNWYSPSFNPATGLYYVQTNEKCSVYTKSDQGDWESGRTYLGGTQRAAPEPTPQRILRALDMRTGQVRWEMPQTGPDTSWGGTLATATGLVFVAEDGGSLMAVDAESGQPLWAFQTNQTWKASPMTYTFDGRQYIAVAAGPNIIALAIPDR